MMGGWMTLFYVFFSSPSVLSVREEDDNDWMCAVKPVKLRLRSSRVQSLAGIVPGTLV